MPEVEDHAEAEPGVEPSPVLVDAHSVTLLVDSSTARQGVILTIRMLERRQAVPVP